MKLDVLRALSNPGQEYPLDVTQAIAPQQVLGDTVTFDDARLTGTLVADPTGSVTVDGRLTSIAHAPCANCLEPATAAIDTAFHETFVLNGDPEDDDVFPYSGSALDFEKLAMTCAVLALPMRFLCREDCPGLARFALSEANEDASQKDMQEHPFAALQTLLKKDEEV